MTGWQLQTRFNRTGHKDDQRVRATCRYLSERTSFEGAGTEETPRDEDGGRHIALLSHHNATCPDSTVMTGWHLSGIDDVGTISLSYSCIPQPTATCVAMSTAWAEQGTGGAPALERHRFECPSGAPLLKGWKLEVDQEGMMRIAYSCCSAAGEGLLLDESRVLHVRAMPHLCLVFLGWHPDLLEGHSCMPVRTSMRSPVHWLVLCPHLHAPWSCGVQS